MEKGGGGHASYLYLQGSSSILTNTFLALLLSLCEFLHVCDSFLGLFTTQEGGRKGEGKGGGGGVMVHRLCEVTFV